MSNETNSIKQLDSLDWKSIREILTEVTCQLRIGDSIEHTKDATHIFMMPHVDEIAKPEKFDFIDLCFIYVGVDREKAAAKKKRMVELLLPAKDAWKDGPSYIHVGASIGDQGAALMLFGLGRSLNIWKILSPQTLMGLDRDDPNSRMMAGQGMVNAQGWYPDGDAEQEGSNPANISHRTEKTGAA